MYCLNLMRIALELAQHNHVYEDIATKFFEHFLHIAEAMTNIGERGHRPVGRRGQVLLRRAAHCPTARITPLKVRSMVGLIPLFAVETLEPELLEQLPEFTRAARVVPELSPRPRAAGVALGRAGPRRAPAAVAAARPPHEEAAASACSTRPSSSPTTACARCRKVHERRSRTCSSATAQSSRVQLPAGRVRLAACSAATPTGAGRSGSR